MWRRSCKLGRWPPLGMWRRSCKLQARSERERMGGRKFNGTASSKPKITLQMMHIILYIPSVRSSVQIRSNTFKYVPKNRIQIRSQIRSKLLIFRLDLEQTLQPEGRLRCSQTGLCCFV
jgi:hypothetical protein